MELKSYRYWKRLLDICIAILLLLPFLALGTGLALVSLWAFRGQVFFRQKRLGYHNRIFTIYKFATLLPEQLHGRTLAMETRQTAWGKFMRDYSLDELPQLLNILKGDMSFIGPRPLLPEYEAIYSPAEARRHLVKPGLSGLAQVNGRNALDWNQKMFFDQQYVTNISFLLDMKILWKTMRVVWTGQEINFGACPAGASAEKLNRESSLTHSAQIRWQKA